MFALFAVVIRHANLSFSTLHWSFICVCLVIPYFSTLPHNRQTFEKKRLLNTKCVFFIFTTTCVWKVARSKKNWVRYKVSVIKQILMELGLDCFRRIIKHKTSWNTFQWEPSCSMRADGKTDMTKFNIFRTVHLRILHSQRHKTFNCNKSNTF